VLRWIEPPWIAKKSLERRYGRTINRGLAWSTGVISCILAALTAPNIKDFTCAHLFLFIHITKDDVKYDIVPTFAGEIE
jgi:hypothetical protein